MMNSILRLQKVCQNPIFTSLSSRLTCVYSKHIHNSVVQNTLLRSNTPSIALSRNFWDTFLFNTRNSYSKDGLDRDNYELIYRSPLCNYIFYAQFVSECVFLVQLFGGLHLVYKSYILKSFATPSVVLGIFSIEYSYISFLILSVFTIQNFLLFHVAHTAMLRIYHKLDTDEYVLVSLSVNPFKSHLLPCKPGELQVKGVNNLLAAMGNVKCKEKNYYVNPYFFKNTWHYNHLVCGNTENE